MAIDFLQVEQLTKSFGELVLFENIAFSVQKGQKTALIAPNGTGKTTLMRIITGSEAQDSGLVTFRNDIRVGFLAQDPELNPELTVLEQVLAADDEHSHIIRSYELAVESNDTEAMHELLPQMDHLNLWVFEQRVKQILSQLRIFDYNKKVGLLSGGQRKRVAMANALIYEPDLLILDEPTNHLDLQMIEWLEQYLMNMPGSLLMVTHDRYFLDRVCTDIIELDQRSAYTYHGNYSEYLRRREERITLQNAQAEKAKNLLRTEQDWINRQPQARGTKAKYRIENYYNLKEIAASGHKDKEMALSIQGKRLGSKILDIKHLAKAWGDQPMLVDFSYSFQRNEKIGIIGPNGVGKSTFLNLITQQIQADSGQIDQGETVHLGYYKQEGIQMPEDKRLIEVITDIAEHVNLGPNMQMSAGQFLEYFLFPRSQHYNYVYKLSGGEKRRLYLMTVLMRQPNFLILDEPTNDLDLLTLNVLEDYLTKFDGCVIIVSHDRFFMDKVVDTLFVFRGAGEVKSYVGNYTAYIAVQKAEEKAAEAPKAEAPKAEKPKQQSNRKTFKERQEFEQLEAALETLNAEKEELEQQMNSGNLAPEAFEASSRRYAELLDEIDLAEMRWLELSEKD